MDSYLSELESVMPKSCEEHMSSVEKKRSCERLLHILIECVIDVCALMVKGLRLGLPSEEEDLFEKLERKKVISKEMKERLKLMRGLRNILVHRYAEVDDELVFENLGNVNDFREFGKEVSSFLRKLEAA